MNIIYAYTDYKDYVAIVLTNADILLSVFWGGDAYPCDAAGRIRKTDNP